MNSEMPLVPGNRLAVGPRNLREDQVDDVLGQLVLAVRDPHLVAAQPVARAERIAFEVGAVRHRARHDVRQARAGLRFRQAHRAVEAAGELVGREDRLLRLGAVHDQQIGVAAGQHAAAADAEPAFREEAVGRHLHDARQLHAADFVVLGGREHPRLGVGAVRSEAGLGQVDALAVEPRLLGVGQPVERIELLARHLLAGVHHRREGLARVIGKARPCRQRLDVEPVMEQEVGRLAIRHERCRGMKTAAAERPPAMGRCREPARLRALRTRRPRPCRRRCTSSRRPSSHRAACLRSARGRSDADR